MIKLKTLKNILSSIVVFAIVFAIIKGAGYVIGNVYPTVLDFLGVESTADTPEHNGVNIIECDNLSVQVDVTTAHTPIAPEERYQFSQLKDNEKEIYLLIEDAVKRGEVSVDVSDYQLDRDRASELVALFRADNPQYFYLGKNHHVTHFEDAKAALEIRLIYTDGNFNDTIKDNALLISANRQLISKQITDFNREVEEIVANIPTDWSDSKKISHIHDYLVNNLEYDEAAVAYKDDSLTHPAYTCYGAAINNLAVCEGYAELFQYLCNLVGVNCTQVVGTGDGEPHMWNAVCLDSVWYHTDVTWDDPIGGEGIYRDYYMISWEKMSADHAIEQGYVKIP